MSKAAADAAAASLPPPPPPPEVAHLVEQLQRHHLAPDASLLSSYAHSDLLQAHEELPTERERYMEALVEEYHNYSSTGSSLAAAAAAGGSSELVEPGAGGVDS